MTSPPVSNVSNISSLIIPSMQLDSADIDLVCFLMTFQNAPNNRKPPDLVWNLDCNHE